MPINANGSKLKVITNVAGHQVDNEDLNYRRSVYHGTPLQEDKPVVDTPKEEQIKPKAKRSLSSDRSRRKSTSDKQNQALLDEVNKDLRTRNIK